MDELRRAAKEFRTGRRIDGGTANNHWRDHGLSMDLGLLRENVLMEKKLQQHFLKEMETDPKWKNRQDADEIRWLRKGRLSMIELILLWIDGSS